MSSFNDFLRSHLNFTTRERRGIIGILGFCILLYLIPTFIGKDEDYSKELKAFEREIALLDSSDSTVLRNSGFKRSNNLNKKWEPFYFNPNTVNAQELEKFGLPQFMIDRFDKYRRAGAKFYVKSDFQKLYGLSPQDYTKINPYIIIITQAPLTKDSMPKFMHKPQATKKIELNKADSLSLISIKGIGPYLSAKIIAYRNALGGFVSIDQLDEIYGLKLNQIEPLKKHFYVDNLAIKRLNVNTANYYQLNNHPYISSKEAKAILNYRMQHGPYSSLNDLETIVLFSKESLAKIQHYLEF